MNTLNIKLDSQSFEIVINDDFIIWLNIQINEDFKNTNITKKEMIEAYISSVNKNFKLQKKVDEMMELF